MNRLETMGAGAKAASRKLAISGTQSKNRALVAIRQALLNGKDEILAANAQDMENAEKSGLKKAFLDRLLLTPERIDGIAAAVAEVEALPDPIGEVISCLNPQTALPLVKSACRWELSALFLNPARMSLWTLLCCALNPATPAYFAGARRQYAPTPHWLT
jgi:gamma-glutamyl phosphate reductase